MFKQILNYLVKNKKAYYIENTWLHASIVDPIRKTLLKALKQQKSGLTVAQFRDLIGGNRKICLLLYALFDREGITRREGDVRCITEKGRKMA
jgi:selenocysteine-specific elongation factor